jgi:uncharacterized membrane protein
MTTEFPTNPRTTMTPSDEQIVQDLLPEMSTAPSEAQNEQSRLAWERDRATMNDFFNNPFKYVNAYWQQYKPIVTGLLISMIAVIAINFAFSLIGFIVRIPLLGSLLQVIGFCYSVWFVKRYLVTAETRQELSEKIDQVKQGIIGTTEEIVGDVSMDAKKSVTIQKSPEELYRYWRNLENLPQFMNYLESVKVLDDKRSHWVAKAPINTTVEWDAEIIDEKENQLLVWKSIEGAQVDSVGSVAFISANGSGTEVKVTMKYSSPAGVMGTALLFGENPQQQLDEDLNRFKQVMDMS